jgi:hypothetical protein
LALPKSEYAQVYFELLEEVIGSGSPK